MSKPKLKSRSGSQPTAAATGNLIMDRAQQIWLAGLGAFAKAQEEGPKLFMALVKQGSSLEQKTRKFTTGKAEEMRGAVESTVGQVRERSQETWDRLEKVFENRVERALGHLGIPGREELRSLSARVEELAQELHKLGGKAVAKPAPKPTSAKRGATRAVARVRDELAEVARELEAAQLDARKTVRRKPVKAVTKKRSTR